MKQPRKSKRRVTPKDEGMARRYARGRVMLVDDDPGILLAYVTCRLSSGHSIIGNWPRVSRLRRRIC